MSDFLKKYKDVLKSKEYELDLELVSESWLNVVLILFFKLSFIVLLLLCAVKLIFYSFDSNEEQNISLIIYLIYNFLFIIFIDNEFKALILSLSDVHNKTYEEMKNAIYCSFLYYITKYNSSDSFPRNIECIFKNKRREYNCFKKEIKELVFFSFFIILFIIMFYFNLINDVFILKKINCYSFLLCVVFLNFYELLQKKKINLILTIYKKSKISYREYILYSLKNIKIVKMFFKLS